MGDVERAGRQALGELRQLVGVLRPDNADPDCLGPPPGIADIEALVDQIAPRARLLPPSGYGILGMRERAELLGGTLDAGPRAGNRFTVLARIPIHPEPA